MQFVSAPAPDFGAPDLACVPTARAESIAGMLAFGALVAVATAWRYRDRAAEDGHTSMWALASLLAAAGQVVGTLAMVPQGCVTAQVVAWMAGCASPWVLAAGFFRSGVARRPPPIGDEGP